MKRFLFLLLFCALLANLANAQEQKYDLIVKNDGTKIQSVISYIDVENQLIYFRMYNDTVEQFYSLNSEYVATILYANGNVEIFNRNGQSPYAVSKTVENPEICKLLERDLKKLSQMQKTGGIFLGCGLGVVGVGALVQFLTKKETKNYTGYVIMGAGGLMALAGVVVIGVYGRKIDVAKELQSEECGFQTEKLNKRPVTLSLNTGGLVLNF